mmetsp:Transcript_70171/g.165073  ORF Transcript_70171/g.165073 Transcript_70171/m.165073 type:complete len:87 (+) Transcript_70171:812-1072(+)
MTSIAIRKPRWHSVCGGRARCPEHHTTVRHAVVVPSWLKKQKRPTADVKDDTVVVEILMHPSSIALHLKLTSPQEYILCVGWIRLR